MELPWCGLITTDDEAPACVLHFSYSGRGISDKMSSGHSTDGNKLENTRKERTLSLLNGTTDIHEIYSRWANTYDEVGKHLPVYIYMILKCLRSK